jgi:hypothetical protein
MYKNILIGRYNNADIKLDDKLLTRIHCEISYSEKDGWVLFDGFEGKSSTNGTWIYINEEIKIYDTMIFKASQTVFQCSLEDSAPE